MLFDLRAPGRKRLIQAIYVVLAVVLVGGTVLFGVGTGLPGLFGSGNDSGSSVDLDKQQQQRLVQVQREVAAKPNDPKRLAKLATLQYAAAINKLPADATSFTPEVKAELGKAVATWHRYLALDPKPLDTGLANNMVAAFQPGGLNRPTDWADAQGVVTQNAVDQAKRRGQPVPVNAYLQLLAAQTAAKRTRQAKITEAAARDAASPSQKKDIEAAIKAAKDPTAQTAAGQTDTTPETITVPDDAAK